MKKRWLLRCSGIGCKCVLFKYEGQPINIEDYGWKWIPDPFGYYTALCCATCSEEKFEERCSTCGKLK